jgi:hypothetical protein
LRFLWDYAAQGLLKGANQNTLDMLKTIVCGRVCLPAPTFKTFTGYIHRLRGYHCLGEHYYHQKRYVTHQRGKCLAARMARPLDR